MPEVRCTVSNCSYWDEGNLCSAEAILVISDDALARISKHDEEMGDRPHAGPRVQGNLLLHVPAAPGSRVDAERPAKSNSWRKSPSGASVRDVRLFAPGHPR